MDTRQHLYEIAALIEKDLTDPEAILNHLINQYLREDVRTTDALHFFHVTRSVKRDTPSIALYILPTTTRTKRKQSTTSLFSNKREKSDNTVPVESAFDKLLNLYYHDTTTNEQKQCIVNILSAFFSFFSNDRRVLPDDLECRLTRWKATDIIADMIPESQLAALMVKGEVSGLDALICQLPDKGKALLEKALVTKSDDPNYKGYIKSFGQLPGAIGQLPSHRQVLIFNSLIAELEDGSCIEIAATSLAALSDLLANFPEIRARAITILNTTMCWSDNQTWRYPEAAYCLNRLIQTTALTEDDECIKTVTSGMKQLVDPDVPKYTAHNIFIEMDELVLRSDARTIDKLIRQLCQSLTKSDDGHDKTRVLQTLCQFSRALVNASEELINLVIDTMIKNLRYLSDFNRHVCPSPADAIGKLEYVLKQKPEATKRLLTAMIDELLSESQSIRRKRMSIVKDNSSILLELLHRWRPLMLEFSDQGAEYIDKIQAYFQTADREQWLYVGHFKKLIKLFEHLPVQSQVLVHLFKQQTDTSGFMGVEYYSMALTALQFSSVTLPDNKPAEQTAIAPANIRKELKINEGDLHFEFRLYAEHFRSDHRNKTHDMANKLVSIATQWPDNHPRQISWLCRLKKYLDLFATKPDAPYYTDLVNRLGQLYDDMKRKDILLSSLPVSTLVGMVDNYAGHAFAVSPYNQVPEYKRNRR
jgi:hypothetical protein